MLSISNISRRGVVESLFIDLGMKTSLTSIFWDRLLMHAFHMRVPTASDLPC